MEQFIKTFADTQSDHLARLGKSTNLSDLEKELKITKLSMPDCVAESLFRTNKISILENRIKELKDEIVPYFTFIKNKKCK